MLLSYLKQLFRGHETPVPTEEKTRLFRLCTSYLFHRDTHRNFVNKVRDWVDRNEYATPGETGAYRAKEILSVVGRHYELNVIYRGAVAGFLLGYTDGEILEVFPEVEGELSSLRRMLASFKPSVERKRLRRLFNRANIEHEYSSIMLYIRQHGERLISRQARFILTSFMYEPADLMDTVWSKTTHTFFRMCVVGEDFDHIRSMVYSALHSGVKNMIAKHTADKSARFKGRSQLAREEAKYLPGFTEQDLAKSTKTQSVMVEVRFSDHYRTDEDEALAMERIAGDFATEESRTFARIAIRQIADRVKHPKKLRVLQLLTGEHDQEFSDFLSNRMKKDIDNSDIFDRSLRRGKFTSYIAACAAFIKVPAQKVQQFIASLRGYAEICNV